MNIFKKNIYKIKFAVLFLLNIFILSINVDEGVQIYPIDIRKTQN